MSTKTEELKEEMKVKAENEDTAKKDQPAKEKKAKKKTYTVDELLNQDGGVELFDEYGRKKKIKVKVKVGKLKKRENRMGYFFMIPYVVGALLCLAYPLITAVQYAFSKVRLTPYGADCTFNGLTNFGLVFEKNLTITVDLLDIATKIILGVPMIVVFALLMAMMLNMKLGAKGFYRTIFFLPVIVVSGPVMRMITSDTSSIQAVDMTIIEDSLMSLLPLWLAESLIWVFENIILLLWYSGVQILIFLAALQKIDTALYEAAKIDGGSNWECFWKITLPTIKNMLLLNAIYTVVFLAQDTVISPLNTSIKNAMNDIGAGPGYASAFAWLYALVILFFIVIVALLFMPKKDVYEKQIKKNKKLEKKTRKKLAKHQKQLIKNKIKLQKAIEKENKMKLAGKDLGGGNYDD